VYSLGTASSASNYEDVTRISGDRYDGVYQVQLQVFGSNGTNDLRIWARDNLDNSSFTTFKDQLDVWGPSSDKSAPVVSLVSVTPTLIEPGETVTVTWSVADPSGLDTYGGETVTKVYSLGTASSASNYEDVTRISGDRYDGVYQVQLQVFGSNGTNNLRIWARDNLDNSSFTTFKDQLEIVSG
jgi:hypothetical protein